MAKDYKEWFLQSEYDLNSATKSFDSGDYIYCMFFCHLSLEKYLKGLYLKSLKKEPPKLHNLIFFLENVGIDLPGKFRKYILDLDDAAVSTRYPDSLTKLSEQFDKEFVSNILTETKELLKWLMTEYKK
ncbi:MAG: HEPN domain-containing protein [Bacteroidetes bacterium]|nr:HEPN domain-containing protein [Bacteroidota bacterium]